MWDPQAYLRLLRPAQVIRRTFRASRASVRSYIRRTKSNLRFVLAAAKIAHTGTLTRQPILTRTELKIGGPHTHKNRTCFCIGAARCASISAVFQGSDVTRNSPKMSSTKNVPISRPGMLGQIQSPERPTIAPAVTHDQWRPEADLQAARMTKSRTISRIAIGTRNSSRELIDTSHKTDCLA